MGRNLLITFRVFLVVRMVFSNNEKTKIAHRKMFQSELLLFADYSKIKGEQKRTSIKFYFGNFSATYESRI